MYITLQKLTYCTSLALASVAPASTTLWYLDITNYITSVGVRRGVESNITIAIVRWPNCLAAGITPHTIMYMVGDGYALASDSNC